MVFAFPLEAVPSVLRRREHAIIEGHCLIAMFPLRRQLRPLRTVRNGVAAAAAAAGREAYLPAGAMPYSVIPVGKQWVLP